ncbi:MAG TPA: succinyldiaminopimelate transaminase [Burkholderiales bacterium]|nr:succinyldiaminopimelate transaminase [Burkholderiales bacterium]
MNPDLDKLQPYPFQKLAALLGPVRAEPSLKPINLSIGEPKHATPRFILDALVENLGGMSAYPATLGTAQLRQAIAGWIQRRHGVELDPASQVLPVLGSREALFSFAQAVVDRHAERPAVVAPNPFYQIYEGAALLAGAEPQFLNTLPGNGFALDLTQLSRETWARTQLLYVCSPANPTGAVLSMAGWEQLFELSDRHGFVIASDECYSEIYFDEANPPLSGLAAARRLGRVDFPRLVSFGSLSKRSNVPGMRSGFVAGDAGVLKKFLLYRTYHGSAMGTAVQAASALAWGDEAHVRENRRMYREKFEQVVAILGPAGATMPDAAFYLWLPTPIDDTEFAKRLFEQYNVTVVPGSFLAREARGVNPGRNFVRIALVAPLAECLEAAQRLKAFHAQLTQGKNPHDGSAVGHRESVR